MRFFLKPVHLGKIFLLPIFLLLSFASSLSYSVVDDPKNSDDSSGSAEVSQPDDPFRENINNLKSKLSTDDLTGFMSHACLNVEAGKTLSTEQFLILFDALSQALLFEKTSPEDQKEILKPFDKYIKECVNGSSNPRYGKQSQLHVDIYNDYIKGDLSKVLNSEDYDIIEDGYFPSIEFDINKVIKGDLLKSTVIFAVNYSYAYKESGKTGRHLPCCDNITKWFNETQSALTAKEVYEVVSRTDEDGNSLLPPYMKDKFLLEEMFMVVKDSLRVFYDVMWRAPLPLYGAFFIDALSDINEYAKAVSGKAIFDDEFITRVEQHTANPTCYTDDVTVEHDPLLTSYLSHIMDDLPISSKKDLVIGFMGAMHTFMGARLFDTHNPMPRMEEGACHRLLRSLAFRVKGYLEIVRFHAKRLGCKQLPAELFLYKHSILTYACVGDHQLRCAKTYLDSESQGIMVVTEKAMPDDVSWETLAERFYNGKPMCQGIPEKVMWVTPGPKE
ncbi:MAG: hypothetical protein PUP46_01960 [Endozoicomonas sp. (ex Botrylloides leachii)]|nr:hypothetical protein [Endozoicomonas sp. (ex Botrylloides leachii)]